MPVMSNSTVKAFRSPMMSHQERSLPVSRRRQEADCIGREPGTGQRPGHREWTFEGVVGPGCPTAEALPAGRSARTTAPCASMSVLPLKPWTTRRIVPTMNNMNATMRSNSCSSAHFCRNVGKSCSKVAIRRDDLRERLRGRECGGRVHQAERLPVFCTASVNSACCCSFFASIWRCASLRLATSCTNADAVAWLIS